MKLTSTLRSSIVRSIMSDIPTIDYREQLLALFTELQLSKLPPPVQALWERKDMREYLATEGVHSAPEGYIAGVPCSHKKSIEWTDEDRQAIAPVEALAAEQRKKLEETKQHLRGALSSCTTVAGLLKRYPEFKKYVEMEIGMPAHPIAETTLITNLMQMGWPK